MIKKILAIAFCFTSLLTAAIAASTQPSLPFKHIVFFGDSLSDNGNMYHMSAHLIPKYPPYFNGRFSNGIVWSDIVSDTLFEKYQVDSQNYAVGGATAYFHNPLGGFLPVTLTTEYDKYAWHMMLKNKDNTLYIIWVGGNDYLPGEKDVNDSTTKVVNAEVSLIRKLITNKNASFLIIDLPDISKAPAGAQRNLVENYKQLYQTNDQKLSSAIAQLQKAYPATRFYNFSFIQHPFIKKMVESKAYREELNQQYHINITNVKDPCWTGGFMKKQDARTILATFNQSKNKPQNTAQLAQWAANTPALAETYRVSQLASNHGTVCDHPDQYIFWDQMHPTATMHKVFANIILDFLNKSINK